MKVNVCVIDYCRYALVYVFFTFFSKMEYEYVMQCIMKLYFDRFFILKYLFHKI